VARMAKQLDSVRHVVLTTGTDKPPGKEISLLSECASAIKKATDLPVHAQCLPPSAPESLSQLKEAGVDTVGLHIESFDVETLVKIAPIKAAIGMKRYREAWKTAVDLFGPNQVSSFLIVGLGEQPDTVVDGSEALADLGVYPFVVPLRPIPGSLMADALPPDPDLMKYVYGKVAVLLQKKGLSASQCKAGCVRCGACSALPAFEMPVDQLTCHVARTEAERMAVFEVRRAIFVLEQKIFNDTDRDEYDSQSIHLVVETEGQVVGTVRIFPAEDNNGHWIGGRLAVKKGYRSSGAGELLVIEAMKCVKRYGCSKFTAHIQVENVPFFSRLGWKGIAPVREHFDRPHQLM
jgi:putative N-acetyltransferase (TIGR04045 family)